MLLTNKSKNIEKYLKEPSVFHFNPPLPHLREREKKKRN